MADIEKKMREIDARGMGAFALLDDALHTIMGGDDTRRQKYIRLVEIADAAATIIAPSTPCKKGCDSCCHISLPITFPEAQALAAASGRKMNPHARTTKAHVMVAKMSADIARYKGVPCPFLVNHACSVYEARPIQCRTHHVLEDDATNCEPHKEVPVARCGLDGIESAAAALGTYEQWADVREFFRE